jgi:rRNA maturation endonuclease Nob1
MSCKGICVKYRAKKPGREGNRYASGQKRCQICDIFIDYPSLFCPCCGYRMRTRPRSRKWYRKMLEKLEKQKKKAKPIAF